MSGSMRQNQRAVVAPRAHPVEGDAVGDHLVGDVEDLDHPVGVAVAKASISRPARAGSRWRRSGTGRRSGRSGWPRSAQVGEDRARPHDVEHEVPLVRPLGASRPAPRRGSAAVVPEHGRRSPGHGMRKRSGSATYSSRRSSSCVADVPVEPADERSPGRPAASTSASSSSRAAPHRPRPWASPAGTTRAVTSCTAYSAEPPLSVVTSAAPHAMASMQG